MTGDRWTLLLVRGEDSPIRQYSVRPRTVQFAFGAVAAVVLSLSGVAVTLGLEGASRLEAERLARQNALLADELAAVHERVDDMEGSLGELSRMDARVRILAGLDSIDGEILQVGIGGPGLGTPEAHPLFRVDSTVGKAAFALRYDLNVMERRARLLTESMREATDSLIAHRDLLESTPSILPAAGLLSSGFSKSRLHPIHHRPLPHEGVDVAAPRGTPILAAAKGRIARAGWASGYGQMIELDHGYGFTTRYGHASKLLVRVGQEVERGDVIALVGSSGIATSSHVHYEVRVNGQPQNPMNYVLPAAVP